MEFKERFPRGDQVARTAIAFANGAGGKIVFGIRNDPRKITGIPDEALFSLEEQIAQHIFDKCEPTIIPEIHIQSVQGKNLLVAEIFPGANKPYHLKSVSLEQGCYVRIGSTTRQASPEMIQELERRRQNISFDAVVNYDLDIQELNFEIFKKDYEQRTGRILDEDKLKNIGLLKSERGHLYATNAAVLLSDAPQSRFPYAKIECARFKGTQRGNFLDQKTIDGPIHASIEECFSFVKKNISLSSSIKEVYREDRWEYPLEAIREALANAVIHRDYAVEGSDIKVAIYDDMLEITSPGPLPDTMPEEELGTGRSDIRNRILAPIFKDLKLIESWGTGISKMMAEVAKYPEIELVIHELGHSFQVQFKKRDHAGTKQGLSRDQAQEDRTSTGQVPDKYRASTGQAPDMIKILTFCKEKRKIKEIMAHIGKKHRETFMNNYLQPLLQSNLVAMTIPDKPNSPKQTYIITDEGLKALAEPSKEENKER